MIVTVLDIRAMLLSLKVVSLWNISGASFNTPGEKCVESVFLFGGRGASLVASPPILRSGSFILLPRKPR